MRVRFHAPGGTCPLTQTMHRIGRDARRFRQDESGSLVIFGVMMLLIMFWAAGLAVDAVRVETTRTQLQNTMDRAVLAAADLSSTQDAKSVVEDYFKRADLSNYLDADTIAVEQTEAGDDLSFRRVTAVAKADVNTLFMKMVGVDTITAGAGSTAEEGITDLEISLVLDVSGSMGWSSSTGNSKIYELREAAKDFAFYMQCNPNAERGTGADCSVQDGKVSISVVPYSEQVTVGATLLEQFNKPELTAVDISDEPKDESCAPDCVATCVTFDAADFGTAGIMARNATEPFWQLKRTGYFDARSRASDTTPTNRTCRADDWREIRPFVEDHNVTIGHIDKLSAGGNTSIDIGMKWGTALLSPQLRPVVADLSVTSDGNGGTVIDPAFSTRPYDYDQDLSMKVIVLMTDGVNTTQYWLRDAYRDGPSEIWQNTEEPSRFSVYDARSDKYYYPHDRTWHAAPHGDDKAKRLSFPELWAIKPTKWYSQFSWLQNPVGDSGNAVKNAQLDAICTAAKDEGVIVYTIGFEVTDESDLVMSKCATSPAHYFSVNGANLAETFGQIASSINQLRLTQ